MTRRLLPALVAALTVALPALVAALTVALAAGCAGDDETPAQPAPIVSPPTPPTPPLAAAPRASTAASPSYVVSRCDTVTAPPRDTEVDTYVDVERGVMQVWFSDATSPNRTWAIDYRNDPTCRDDPAMRRLIDHVIETAPNP